MRILMYHSIGEENCRLSVPLESFRRQMAWLQRSRRRVLTLREAIEEPGPGPCPLVLTFDDGYADFYTRARAVLEEYGLRATVFVATGFVGQVAGWGNAAPATPLLTWAQMRELAAAGFEFGAHTVTHLDVRKADDEVIAEELARSKAVLEEELGQEVVSFAYPFGYLRAGLPELVARAGYRCAVLAGGHRDNDARRDRFMLRRIPVWAEDSLLQFCCKARGWTGYRYYTEKCAGEWHYQWKMIRQRCGRGR